MSSNRSRQARRPRPLPQGDALFTPDASPSREAFEHRSATSLLWLHQLPPWLFPVLSACLLIAGFALQGWAGAIVLFCLAAVLGWLAVLSWPRLSGQGRVLRVVIIAALVAVAVVRGLH
ncbi:MAG TPA: DUF6703 family protein [Streptosporangiaceae bacterium]|nr:DUF6703 family protein [Streptosporangiaceae bacterium]